MRSLLISLLLTISSFPLPAAITEGQFTGETELELECSLALHRGSHYYNAHISFDLEGEGLLKSCQFDGTRIGRTHNQLHLGGEGGLNTCKAIIHLDESGRPIAADMGIGTFIKIGYDVHCTFIDN